MIFHIDFSDGRAIYLQIADEIRRAIARGALVPHDPLPSVRQLAGDLRINPNTVQQAYRELERERVVYVRRGRGTFVAESEDADAGRAEMVAELARKTLREARLLGLGLAELTAALEAAAHQREESS